jgi:iron(III) transport system permease protein
MGPELVGAEPARREPVDPERLGARGATARTGLHQAVAVLTVAAVVLLVGYPIARLVPSANLTTALGDPGLATAAWHSLALAVVVTAVSVPLGASAALVLRRPDIPLRRTLQVAMLLPLVIPQFVLGYSWTQAYGRAGFLDTMFGLSWPGLLGPVGVAVVLIVNAVPLCYLLTVAGLRTRAQPELEWAARTSGGTPATALWTITVALLRPVLGAAAVLTFVATLESFAVPEVLGTPAGFNTVTTRIYSDLALGSDPASFDEAISLALGLVLVAAVFLIPADVILAPRLRSERSSQAAATSLGQVRTRRSWLVAAALWVYLAVAVFVPTIALVSASITRAVGLPPTVSNWTTSNFTVLANRNTGAQFLHSLELAVAAASILLILGSAVSVAERRLTGRALAAITTLTFVVPGSTLAVGVLVAYGRWLDGTLTLILLAYLAKLWALAARPISSALDRLPTVEVHAARTSGAGPGAAIRTIVLPALAPALIGAWLLVFVTALHEVTISSLLYSARTETLAVAVLNSQELGDIGRTAALSVTLSLLVLLAALPATAMLRRAGRRGSATPAEAPSVR